MLEERRSELLELLHEFQETFVQSPTGQQHLGFYEAHRQTGRQNFEAVQAAIEVRGVKSATDLTDTLVDQILHKLLPHSDSEKNRQAEVWIHHASAITGSDIKAWYDKKSWRNWKETAFLIFEFIRNCNSDDCISKPLFLKRLCTSFVKNEAVKSFQCGMLTPILNALNPQFFLLINSKSQRVIEYFTGDRVYPRLELYFEANEAGKRLISELSEDIQTIVNSDLSNFDCFDMFCHWLVAVKKYDLKVQYTNHSSPKVLQAVDHPSINLDHAFSPQAFALLEKLHHQPQQSIYNQFKQGFKQEVEIPFQELMQAVAADLPDSITSILETEKRIFARIPKNDFGQGGAWDFYWGAFYPKGGKRTEDAQLFLWISHERIEFGFYIGQYGSRQRQQFVESCSKYRDELESLLGPTLQVENLIFGSRHDVAFNAKGQAIHRHGNTFQDWLGKPIGKDIHVAAILSKEQVLGLSKADLVHKISQVYQQVFPLVLLALHNDPFPHLGAYLEPDEEDEDENAGAIESKITPEFNPDFSLTDCERETFHSEVELQSWIQAIHRKKQVIFYGPPGTGKTYLAKHLAQHLLSGSDGIQTLIQFHPAYTYEDFIQGIRPQTGANGLEYPLKPGRFLEFCDKARDRNGICVLIIDEINRANLAQVFGELMYLLEYRDDQDFTLAGGQPFSIPANVRILGTMNTADRSIALVDHALRRRFAFIPLYPDFEILRKYHQNRGTYGNLIENLIEQLKNLNQTIGDRNYHLGTSFFLCETLTEELPAIWQLEIEPYLEEYFFDQPEIVDQYRWETLKAKIEPATLP